MKAGNMLMLHFLYKLGSCTAWTDGEQVATRQSALIKSWTCMNFNRSPEGNRWHSIHIAAV